MCRECLFPRMCIQLKAHLRSRVSSDPEPRIEPGAADWETAALPSELACNGMKHASQKKF